MIILLSALLVVNLNTFKVDAMSPLEAIETYKTDIISSARKTGVWASVTAAQLILESGNPMSDLAMKDNNFFGIKWSSKYEERYPGSYPVEYNTLENYGKGNVKVKASFTHFTSPSDGITEHSVIWWNGNYYPELKILYNLDSTMDEFLREMANGPYATDKNYYSKLRKVIDDNNLEDLDKEAFPEGRQFCGFGTSTVGEYKYPDDDYNDTGDVGTTTKDSATGKTYVLVKEEDLVGMYPKSFLTDDAFNPTLPTYDNLSDAEKVNLDTMKDAITLANDWNIYDMFRVFTVFLGLCMLVYAVLLFTAYLFDRVNNVFELSLVSLMSLGVLQFSDDEDDTNNTHILNKSRLLKVEVLLVIGGFFLVAGGVFKIMIKIIQLRAMI